MIANCKFPFHNSDSEKQKEGEKERVTMALLSFGIVGLILALLLAFAILELYRRFRRMQMKTDFLMSMVPKWVFLRLKKFAFNDSIWGLFHILLNIN